MSRRSINIVSIVLLLVIGLAVAGLVYARWSQHGTLVGEMRHDFGTVWIDADSTVVEHTFVLTNRSEKPVVFMKANSSCSCTKAGKASEVIPAGATFELPTTFRLSATGPKKVGIDVLLDEEGVTRKIALLVSAVGRRRQALRSERNHLQVTTGGVASLLVLLEDLESDEKPPAPQFVHPESLEVDATPWELKRGRKAAETQPAVWQTRVRVKLIGEEIPAGEMLIIKVPPDREVAVQLVDHLVIEEEEIRQPLPLPSVNPPPGRPGAGRGADASETPEGAAPGGR